MVETFPEGLRQRTASLRAASWVPFRPLVGLKRFAKQWLFPYGILEKCRDSRCRVTCFVVSIQLLEFEKLTNTET